MAPTLAELRAHSGPQPLPKGEKTVTLVEGQHLLADAQRLKEETSDLLVANRRVDEEGNQTAPPAKAGEGAREAAARKGRLEKIPEELSAIVDRLADFQGVVGLVGKTGGDWQRFKDEFPPREDNRADEVLAGGYCSSTAVFEDLGSYVKTWNGEDLKDGDWDSWLAERITYSDRRDLVREVVMMHEQAMARAPKSLSSSSPMGSSGTD